MAERKVSNAEIKAGVFLTICLALFVAMLLVLGKFGRLWRGKVRMEVAFTHISALRSEAPVRYNGMEIGTVHQIHVTRIDDDFLKKLPPVSRRDLRNLPLTGAERERLEALPETNRAQPAAPSPLDEEVRRIIVGRTMVVLTLDLLAENDQQRYRTDDEFRIASGLMGESSVEIRTGAGSTLSKEHDKYLLGVGGDMYTDLGTSISQVKDILGSLTEMIGGDDNHKSIRDQLDSFETFSARIEGVSTSMAEKLPQTWDHLDRQIDDGRQTLNDIEARAAKMKPELERTLEKACASIKDIQKTTVQSLGESQAKIADYRKSALASIGEWKDLTAQYRDSIPAQAKNAREWSDRFLPTVTRIDNFLSRADDQLDKGIDSTRTSLREYLQMAGNLEETTYQLWKRPWMFAHPPTDEEAAWYHLEFRQELAQKRYLEVRPDLNEVLKNLGGAGPSGAVRAERVGQLVRDADGALDLKTQDSPADDKKKRRK